MEWSGKRNHRCFNTPEGVEGFSSDIVGRVLAESDDKKGFNTPEGVEGFSRESFDEDIQDIVAAVSLEEFQYPGGC